MKTSKTILKKVQNVSKNQPQKVELGAQDDLQRAINDYYGTRDKIKSRMGAIVTEARNISRLIAQAEKENQAIRKQERSVKEAAAELDIKYESLPAAKEAQVAKKDLGYYLKAQKKLQSMAKGF